MINYSFQKLIKKKYHNRKKMFCRLIFFVLTYNIQIFLKLDVSLKTYINQIENGTFEFPTYSHFCPICHGDSCCIRHGYYFRQVIDENGTFYKSFPVARYLCQRKWKAKLKDRTFSLLPWQLIPYRKFTITFLLAVAEFQTGHSIKERLDTFYPVITIPSQLEDLDEIVHTALEKLKISGLINPDTSLKYFTSFSFDYVSETDENIRGPTGLSWDYYNKHGGYYRNSQFLYGRASQFR